MPHPQRIHCSSFRLRSTDTNKRKLTLLALIDELTELRDEEQEREKDVNYGPTAGERLSGETEEVERFQVFDKRIHKLDLKLHSFTNAVRMLGASVGLLNAAYDLRARLTQTQYLFRENAAEQFDDINHEPKPDAKLTLRRRLNGQRNRSPSPDKGHTTNWWPGEIEELPAEMESLALGLQEFLDRLNEMPDFVDESMNNAIMPFAGDLMYRASCLREFEGQLRFTAVAKYINDLSEDLGEHMDRMGESLDTFMDVGIPTIRFSEKHTATSLQNLSTIATFLSGVTATTLQVNCFICTSWLAICLDNHGSPLPDLVNTLWISSLVFSIAAAINSQLACHWHSSQYRSPQNYVPRWATIWIMRAPLFFLVASVMAYMTGLGLFTHSSGQSPVVSIMITTFTVVTAFTWCESTRTPRLAYTIALMIRKLVYVGLWVTSERWANTRTKGRFLRGSRQEPITNVTPTKHGTTMGSERTHASTDEIKRPVTHTSKHIMASLVDVPHKFVRHWISALSTTVYFRDRLGPQDAEAQSGTMRTDSPTNMFGTDNGSGNLGINATSEERKLSDLGKGVEDTIHEDLPLVVNTMAPSLITSPPSAGESSKVLDNESAVETSVPTTEVAGPVTPRNAKFREVAKR
ncbi:hypothetical protein FRC10_002262, partial [Ceratobasidium sp. 414]